jgi:hypothetical protein
MRYLLALAASALLAPVARAQQFVLVPACQPFALAAYAQAIHEARLQEVTLVTISNPDDSRPLDRQTLAVKGEVVQTFKPTVKGTCEVGYPHKP